MKKFICGLYDTVSGNVGDVCLVDNIKEFDFSIRKLLSDTQFPDYAVNDCCAVVYGELHYEVDVVPYIIAYDTTRHILSGRDPDIVRIRKDKESFDEEMAFDDE